RERDLVDLARERERHLVVLVVDRRAGIGPDVEVLVPLKDERDRVLHLLARDFSAVDLQYAGAAPAEPTIATGHERRRPDPGIPDLELERVLARRQGLGCLPLDALQVHQVPREDRLALEQVEAVAAEATALRDQHALASTRRHLDLRLEVVRGVEEA